MRKFGTIGAITLAMVAGIASGDVIISNIADADSSGTRFGPFADGITTEYKAAGFTMGAQAFSLDSVTIDISDILTGGTFDASVYSDSGGSGPAAQLVALSGSAVGGAGLYSFTPDSPLTLDANTTYWVYLHNNETANFLWDASASAPTGAHASSAGYHFNGGSSSFMNKYEVNGTIPAPATAGVLGLLGLAAVRRRR